MIKYFLISFSIIFVAQQAFGQELSIITEQKEYYFLVGEDVNVPAILNNTYPRTISGDIQYTITSTIQQPGLQSTNQNSGNFQFQLNPGVDGLTIQFGQQQVPAILQTSLRFTYVDTKENVLIHNFTVYIVADPSQKNNQQNPSQSSSQSQQGEQQNQQGRQGQQQNQQGQQEQQGNQQGNQRDPLSQQLSSRLQNNQIPQDGAALQQRFQDEVNQGRQQEQEFREKLFEDEELQKAQDELQQQGYELTDSALNAESEQTGNFSLDYQNQEGKWANLEGRMSDGEVTDLRRESQVSQEAMGENLRNDESFQELNQQLLDEGFVETGTEFAAQNSIPRQGSNSQVEGSEQGQDKSDQGNADSSQGNQGENSDLGTDAGTDSTLDENLEPTAEEGLTQQTKVAVQYQNLETNATATIEGSFTEEELEEVVVTRSDSPFDFLLWIIPLWVIVGLIAYLLYRKHWKGIQVAQTIRKPFDYRKEARRLMTLARDDYSKENYKNAFSNGGQAIRLLTSYQLGLNKQVTNKELLNNLKWTAPNFMEISNALGTCSLVEFAKAQATNENFEKVVSVFELIHKSKL